MEQSYNDFFVFISFTIFFSYFYSIISKSIIPHLGSLSRYTSPAQSKPDIPHKTIAEMISKSHRQRTHSTHGVNEQAEQKINNEAPRD